MSKFTKDLAVGTRGEAKVIDLLTNLGIKCEKALPKSPYDIVIEDKILGEVKYDKMAQITGNIAIEVRNSKSGLPSGLYITQSHLWFQIVGAQIYVASVADVKTYVDATINTSKLFCAGGDKNADLLLFPCKEILPIVFYDVISYNSGQFQKLLEKLCS
jgi:hypothetical protein